MATTYDSIYDRFLSKITDYELNALTDAQIENSLHKFLKSAISDFKFSNKNLVDRNDETMQFNIDLTDNEQEILAKYMLVHWITPNLLRLENVRNTLGNKDFQLYSGANFLDKLSILKDKLTGEADSEMIYYYYAN